MKQSATTKAALPEKLSVDAYVSDTCEGNIYSLLSFEPPVRGKAQHEAVALEMSRRYNAHEQMREALQSMLSTFGQSRLERNPHYGWWTRRRCP